MTHSMILTIYQKIVSTKRYQNSVVLQTLIFSQVHHVQLSVNIFNINISVKKLNFANLLFYQHITISKRQLITDLMIVPITISNNHTNYSPILTIQHIKSHFQYILEKYSQWKFYYLINGKICQKAVKILIFYYFYMLCRLHQQIHYTSERFAISKNIASQRFQKFQPIRYQTFLNIGNYGIQKHRKTIFKAQVLDEFQIFNSDRKPFLFFCHFFSQIAIRCEQKKVQRNFVSQSFLTYTVIMQLTSGRFAYDFTTGKSSWIYIVYQDCKHQILLLLVFVKQLIILVRVKFQLKRESRSKNLDQTYLHKMYNPNCNTINRKNQNHMQIARSQFTLLSVSVTDKIYGYSCRIQSTHILKPVKIIKTQDRHQCLTYLTINQIIEFPLRIFFQYILKV
eukprot:TRINITY_DN622_c0_g1_i10.p1 TRINITY_DN622_c0_g1~~TRINITY_DN622_c0_g1_i10.p1  ORF type:complete len:395 (-),score=-58.78 TRINITY_DN622_c0_g1_i10:95-1279(-)